MGTREWVLTAAVIVVPLIIAVVVTAWSLEQARYRPKRRKTGKAAVLDDGLHRKGEAATRREDAQ